MAITAKIKICAPDGNRVLLFHPAASQFTDLTNNNNNNNNNKFL